MLRYNENSDIRKNNTGKRQYSSLRYPSLSPKTSDIYLYSKAMTRIDLLAHAYYGDTTLWPIIARANNIGQGTLFIPPGIRLRIPWPLSISELQSEFLDVNEKS